MKRYIDVMTGELKDVKGYGVIQTQALGSCIALAAYNKENKYAALAHIMLPDYSPQKNKTEIFRYAGNAIDELEKKIEENNCKKEDTIFFIVGAGNVLQREDDTICESNIKSVSELARKKDLNIVFKDVGGFKRRSCLIDLDEEIFAYSKGDEPYKYLEIEKIKK